MIRGFGVPSGAGVHISMDIFDTFDSIQSTVADIFNNLGMYCVQWANGALRVFRQLTWSAKDMLTFSTEDPTFKDFTNVVTRVSSVLTIIASSLLVLFFLTSLASDAWDNRHDVDIWSFAKDLIKLIVSVVVINNALLLTKLIFNSGAALAQLVAVSSDAAQDFGGSMKLNDLKTMYLINGVTGIRGVFILIAYVLGAVVITVCGVLITVEIYQRILKIYILIPCSTLAFSTFVIGHNKSGGEVFTGYVKSICQVSLEALVIMLSICFTYTLCSNSKIMEALFPADVADCTRVSASCADDYIALSAFIFDYNVKYDETTGSNGFKSYIKARSGDAMFTTDNEIVKFDLKNVNSDLLTKLDGMEQAPAVLMYNLDTSAEQQPIKTSMISNAVKSFESGTVLNTYYFYLYPEVSVKDALMLLVQIIFPCMLCVGAVKAAGQYSGMIVGKG